MIFSLATREQLSYQKTGMGFSMQAGSSPLPLTRQAASPQGDQLQLSDASRTALQYKVQDLDFSGGWTEMNYDVDSGITATARYSLNYSEHQETLDLAFNFSAESLGLSKEAFKAFGGKPIELKFEFYQQSIEYKKETNLTISQTTRGADEIISDIAKSLREVFLQKGDETVELTLDSEAFQALIGNAQTKDMIDDIAALIGIINHLRLNGGPRNYYHIYISGKGKPKIDYQEEVNVKVEGSKITIRMTIQPPQEETIPQEKSVSEPAEGLNDTAN